MILVSNANSVDRSDALRHEHRSPAEKDVIGSKWDRHQEGNEILMNRGEGGHNHKWSKASTYIFTLFV
jgi:hypothetical protein